MENDFVSRFKYVRIQGQELVENTMYALQKEKIGVYNKCLTK